LLLALLALAGCANPDAAPREATTPIEVIDDGGNTVRLAAPARYVLSLIPARTDAVLALGAADRLVARTQYDHDPRIAHLPSIGNALSPSVEWIVARRPDLVIAWPDAQSRSVVTRLVQLGIPVYASRVQTIGDTRRAVGHLGILLGLTARADSVLDSIDREHARVRAAVAGLERPDVLYLIGLDPVLAAGPGTFIDELIEIAGGTNIFRDQPALWPQVSLEEIVRRDPDVIMIATGDPEGGGFARRITPRPGWRETSAVRTGRVHELDAGLFNRPGPSVGPAARTLAGLLHPQAFMPR
jgi:iron complex transport system substrate-binding protein